MYRCSMALAICSESKARIWFLFPRLSSVYVILSLPRIPFLATALVPYPTAKPRRLAACSPCISILFALSKFKSDLPSALPLSERDREGGREGNVRSSLVDLNLRPLCLCLCPSPSPSLLFCSVSAAVRRVRPSVDDVRLAPPLQILVACCLVSHCGSGRIRSHAIFVTFEMITKSVEYGDQLLWLI